MHRMQVKDSNHEKPIDQIQYFVQPVMRSLRRDHGSLILTHNPAYNGQDIPAQPQGV